jgi:hypothetical protein
MEQLKVIGAVLASLVLAGTYWWYSGTRTPPSRQHQDGEKEGVKVKNVIHRSEVPASLKLRHERILRAKPKKRQEEQQAPNSVYPSFLSVYSQPRTHQKKKAGCTLTTETF